MQPFVANLKNELFKLSRRKKYIVFLILGALVCVGSALRVLAADLIREDGAWRIWHLAVYTDFVTPAGMEFDPEKGAAVYPAGLGIEETPTVPGGHYDLYTDVRPLQKTPMPPVPYRTFSGTFSYGPAASR